MNLYAFRVPPENETVFVHALNETYAAAKAAKISRLIFRSTKHTRPCLINNPSEPQTVIARQMSVVLGEPVFTGPSIQELRNSLIEAELRLALMTA